MFAPTIGATLMSRRPEPEPDFVLILRESVARNPESKRLFERAADAIQRIEQKRLDGMENRFHDAMFEANHFDFEALKKLDDEANRALLFAALLVNPYAAAAVFLGKEASKALANAAAGAAQQAAKEAAVFIALGTIATACKGANYLIERLDPTSRPMHVTAKRPQDLQQATVEIRADVLSTSEGKWNRTHIDFLGGGRVVHVSNSTWGRGEHLVSFLSDDIFPQLKRSNNERTSSRLRRTMAP